MVSGSLVQAKMLPLISEALAAATVALKDAGTMVKAAKVVLEQFYRRSLGDNAT